MKKNLWLAALVGVALTGCVNEENSPLESKAEKLTFASVLGTQSRANYKGEIEGAIYPTAENFSVYCLRYKGNFNGWEKSTDPIDYFKGAAKTQHQGGDKGAYWDTVDETYYWPLAEYNLAFAAYSPSELNTGAIISYGKTGLNIENFVTEEKSSDQYDLLYSERTVDKNNSNNGNTAVPIKFKHALSSIVFSVQDDVKEKLYTLKKLEVVGKFYTKGNFSQGITEVHAAEGTAYSESDKPTWTLETTAPTVDKTYLPFDRTSSGTEPIVTTHGEYILPQIFTGGEEALLMIPQDVPADAKVRLYFETDLVDLTGNASDGWIETKKTGDAAHTSYTLEVNLSDFKVGGTETTPGESITKWEPGVRYIYRFQFGGTPHIYFTPTVDTWTQHNTAVYKIQ